MEVKDDEFFSFNVEGAFTSKFTRLELIGTFAVGVIVENVPSADLVMLAVVVKAVLELMDIVYVNVSGVTLGEV